MSHNLKKFTPYDKGIKLVTTPSDIDPSDDDPDVLRAVLSCGHVAEPESLTSCCKVQLEKKQTQLRCPVRLCNKVWPYKEIRKLAKLTAEEQQYFEEKLGEYVTHSRGIKECPGCHIFVERIDTSNLCVECALCSATQGRVYEFCWQCDREWKGTRPRADRCDNLGCVSRDLELLRYCKRITLSSVQNIKCPSMRACPTCGTLIEHNTENCKMILCFQCNIEFCFLCLKPSEECLQTSTHFVKCSDGVAPRQTTIPRHFS
ncbi:potential E3 ubiquitin-protein ligase ariadne-2-like [Misgurnus anguillicaudatus]|uniref:potential E3 ubiquitin-protein ligase ariadne-2-like n=1 Tax=Misgurnus anguillicaudatus TaxID=75329 RepID=UPI003CCF44BF